ncbi:MAG TPA: NAD(P)-dependent alcohol dehydrogenase [Gaiellaceae bacterium]
MKAFRYERYGSPDVLELREVEKPAVTDDGVLVRVHASSVNPVDWHTLTGDPYLVRLHAGLLEPKTGILGVDFAGTVEAVGGNVQRLRPGDEVFGGRTGAFAEYVCVPEDRGVVSKPAGLTSEEAAALPVAAISALQALRDKGGVQSGQRVLVNGASGGVGTFAVQIAKALGAEVTGVCSTRNVELVQSIGADHVVDYTQEDFTLRRERYHLMLDIAGNRSWSDCRRVLDERATVVLVGGPKTNRWIGPLGHVAWLRLVTLRGSRKAIPFLATITRDSLEGLVELVQAGNVTPLIDRRYDFGALPEALRYLGAGHAQGKVVVSHLENALG